MALTAEQLQAQIDAIDAELVSPVRQIGFADRSETRRSTAEAIAARDHLAAQLRTIQSRSRQTLIVASKGLG